MTTDMASLELCGQCAKQLLESDPMLQKSENKLIAQNVKRLFDSGKGDIFN